MKKKTNLRQIKFSLNPAVYPKEAIYAACYVFLDRFYLYLDQVNSRIKVYLKPKPGIKLTLNSCRGEFRNELLNNTLRLAISKRNQKIREMIVREALFFSQPKKELDDLILKKQNGKRENWKKDPQGIAIPWETKYGKKAKK